MPKPKRAGKVKDKWREKKWVTVPALPGFDRAPIAYVPITSNEIAMGRVIETTLFDISKQDPQQEHADQPPLSDHKHRWKHRHDRLERARIFPGITCVP